MSTPPIKPPPVRLLPRAPDAAPAAPRATARTRTLAQRFAARLREHDALAPGDGMGPEPAPPNADTDGAANTDATAIDAAAAATAGGAAVCSAAVLRAAAGAAAGSVPRGTAGATDTGALDGAIGTGTSAGPAPPSALAAIPHAPAPPMALGERVVRECMSGQQGELVTRHLAALVARFCNAPAVSDGGAWELHIDINPNVLAATSLHLQLSAFSLSLRFETPDARSQRLICDNSAELRRRLATLLQGQLDVTVTCW